MKILPESHVDHGLSSEVRAWLLERFADRAEFFVETVELPETVAPVRCALVGPAVGDEPVDESDVHYSVRGSRKCASRLVEAWPRMTRTITVIAGPFREEPCALYTAYGGPVAPREPGDPSIKTWAELEESRSFWAAHALADGGSL